MTKIAFAAAATAAAVLAASAGVSATGSGAAPSIFGVSRTPGNGAGWTVSNTPRGGSTGELCAIESFGLAAAMPSGQIHNRFISMRNILIARVFVKKLFIFQFILPRGDDASDLSSRCSLRWSM
mmetsp:Transcript_6592/g.19451  ORF Transcript_6592/g.19451 Transcript_6592/m.19451 type:complete len:124 (-) Transcript_6592:709-1080(-)